MLQDAKRYWQTSAGKSVILMLSARRHFTQIAATAGSPVSKYPREPTEPQGVTERTLEDTCLFEDTTYSGDCRFGCLTTPSLRGLTLLEDILSVDY